jgi:hypothetical protein
MRPHYGWPRCCLEQHFKAIARKITTSQCCKVESAASGVDCSVHCKGRVSFGMIRFFLSYFFPCFSSLVFFLFFFFLFFFFFLLWFRTPSFYSFPFIFIIFFWCYVSFVEPIVAICTLCSDYSLWLHNCAIAGLHFLLLSRNANAK